ncbi:MAG: DNA alkylation repair protein [Patescibacteria group bacterium]|nr:DNA alkylation repair protein [Patescibacteria group bacterium]
MKNLYQKIYKDLAKHKNKKRAELNKKYHKYDGYESWGLSSPEFAKVMKKYKKTILDLNCDEILELSKMLYKIKIGEFIFAGTFVLENRLDCLDKKWLPFFDEVLEYFISWGTIDDFCIDVLQPVLLKYPKETLRFLKKWNQSKNMWKRRTSVVAFVRKIGESGKFTDEALVLCENLIWAEEDMVQKGVGWCLKDIMRGDKKKVFDYVKKLRKRGVPATITLYAIRNLKGKERSEILKIKSNKL